MRTWEDDMKDFDRIIQSRHLGPSLGLAPQLRLEQRTEHEHKTQAEQFDARLIGLDELRSRGARMHLGSDGNAMWTFKDKSTVRSMVTPEQVKSMKHDDMVFVRRQEQRHELTHSR